jgi:hypothetical protein
MSAASGAAEAVVPARVVMTWCRFNRRHLPRVKSADPTADGVYLGSHNDPARWAVEVADWNAKRAERGLPPVALVG